MTFNIPTEFEPVIRNAIESGAFATPEAALVHALSLLAKEQGQPVANGAEKLSEDESHDSWSRRLRSFASNQKPTGHAVDDSRESIYPDRF